MLLLHHAVRLVEYVQAALQYVCVTHAYYTYSTCYAILDPPSETAFSIIADLSDFEVMWLEQGPYSWPQLASDTNFPDWCIGIERRHRKLGPNYDLGHIPHHPHSGNNIGC
jgi:hypothetical protein